MGAEAVDGAIFHAHGDHAAALAIFHDQVEREIFDEKVGVVFQALLIERVEHGVTGPVCRRAGALGRRAIAHILGHATESPLIDFALVRPAERHAEMFELVNRRRGFAAHIFNRVLVPEPIGAFDRVIHMPGPVIRPHIAERGGNPALRRHGMRAGREHLGDTGGFQPGFGDAHCGAEARAAGPDNHGVIGVINDLVGVGHDAQAPNAILRTQNTAVTAPAMT